MKIVSKLRNLRLDIRLTGSETLDEGRLASRGVDLGEELSSGRQVGRPAEPSSVAGVEVHIDTDGVQLLDGVSNTLL